MAFMDFKSLSSYRSILDVQDSGFGSQHSARTLRTLKTLKTSKSKHTNSSKATKRSVATQTTYASLASTESFRSKKSQFSRDREKILGVLPKIREYNRNKLEKLLMRDPLYNGSEQIVFYDSRGNQVTGTLSGQDSGIMRDVSEFSHTRPYGKVAGLPHHPLSPVKSESASPQPKSGPRTPKQVEDWRKFFDLVPNVAERKQMELIRRELEQGKLKHHTLPPISYFAEDLPMLPGEAGTRLLKTVRVGEKKTAPGDGRHRIESVPGKLAVHTQNEDAGLSNFGILQMQWTTGVPWVRDHLQPPPRIPQHRSQNMIQEESENMTRANQVVSEEELNLPYIDTASPTQTARQSPNQFEWEYPLPPPPAKESRIQVPTIRKDHESYCKYYNLVKKKLHLYTSQQKEKNQCLPEIITKRLRKHDQSQGEVDKTGGKSPKKQRSLTKTESFSSVLLPPIKLGQLVKIW